jgi:hypothetical protein
MSGIENIIVQIDRAHDEAANGARLIHASESKRQYLAAALGSILEQLQAIDLTDIQDTTASLGRTASGAGIRFGKACDEIALLGIGSNNRHLKLAYLKAGQAEKGSRGEMHSLDSHVGALQRDLTEATGLLDQLTSCVQAAADWSGIIVHATENVIEDSRATQDALEEYKAAVQGEAQ